MDVPGFKQFWCWADGSYNLMMKARTVLKAPVKELIECMLNIEQRKKWESAMEDIRVFFTSDDGDYTRMYFNFKSPVPMITYDRDFYFAQMVRRDFP